MVSPVIDEGSLLATLNLPVSVEFAEPLRTAAVYAILNAHDRKVQRPFYADLLGYSVYMHEQLRRAEVMSRILMELEENTVDQMKVMLKDRIQSTIADATEARARLKDCVASVMQCPMDEDRIH